MRILAALLLGLSLLLVGCGGGEKKTDDAGKTKGASIDFHYDVFANV